LVNQTSELFK